MLCESFQTLKHQLFAYSWTLPDQNVASCDVVMSYSMIQKMFYGGETSQTTAHIASKSITIPFSERNSPKVELDSKS